MINRIAELAEENADIKAENDTLKSQLDFEVQKKEVFEIENERLKLKTEELENRMRTLDDETITVEITEDEFEKYKQLKSCLQEIKKIADARCDECKYGKDGISCKYGDCGEAKLHLIIQLITKAVE